MAFNTTIRSLTPGRPRRWKHQNSAVAVALCRKSYHKKHSGISSPVNFSQSLMKNEISARKLAAGLWQLRFLEVSGYGGAYTKDRWFPNSKSKLEASMSMPYIKSPKEEATKWNPSLNEHDSIVTVLLEELLQAKNSINKLKASQKSSKKKAKQLLQTLEEEKVKWKSREHHKIEAMLDELKDKLSRERRSRKRMEIVNEKLVNELAAANESAKEFMANYEKEKRERELTEEVCDELAKQLGKEKAKFEALMREVEEEREMMRMSEQFREERVQMKLSDAKDLLEEKYNQMVHLISYLQILLTSQGGNSSELEEAVESVNIGRIIEFCYDLTKSSNEELGKNNGNSNPTLSGPLSTIVHIETVDEERLRFMSHHSSGLGRINNSPEFCDEEDKFSRGPQMGEGDRDTCVINVNQLRYFPNTEITTIFSDTKYSQHRSQQGDDGSKKLKEAKSSIQGCVTSNTPTENLNPHITRGMRGCIEWPRGIPKTNSKVILLEERVKSQKSQLQHFLKTKPS